MRFTLTMTLAVSLSLFAMNVAIHASTTVDLMKSNNQSISTLAMLSKK